MGLGRVGRVVPGGRRLGHIILVGAELDTLAPGFQTAVAVLACLSASGADKISDHEIVTDYGQNNACATNHQEDDAGLQNLKLKTSHFHHSRVVKQVKENVLT